MILPGWRRLLDNLRRHKEWFTTGTAIITAIAVVLAFFFPHVSQEIIKYALIFIFCAVMSILAIFRRPEYVSHPRRVSIYSIDLPCSPADLDGAIDIAKYYFGTHSIKPEIVRSVYRKNRYSVIVARNHEGKVVGYLDSFGLQPDKLDAIIDGSLAEEDLTTADFLDFDEAVQARRLYIGGIAIRASSKYEVDKITQCLVNAGFVLLKGRYLQDGQSDVELIATAYSKEGGEVLSDFGFGKRRDGKFGSGRPPVYWRTINNKQIARYLRESAVAHAELILNIEE